MTPPPDFGTGLLGPGECLTDERPGVWGYKYQCKGAFIAHLGVTHNGNDYAFYIPAVVTTPFGDGVEPYEHAKVIACCGEYDETKYFHEQTTFAENCLLDFRQQACMSLAAGLKTLIDEGTVPLVFRPKAKKVQNWIAENTSACIAGFVDTHANATLLQATWNLPDDGPWTPTLDDVYVKIDYASAASVYRPEPGTELCNSLHDNNDKLFADLSGTPLPNSYKVELDEADGDLLGPVYGGSRISGAGDFASLATSCSDPYCSIASFSDDSTTGSWAIDRMVLYVDGPLVVSNGVSNETITDGRIELYKQAHGTITYVGGVFEYTIPAGAAHFLVVGASSGDVATLPLPNTTDITATLLSNGVWLFDPFEIEYVDDLSNTWTLTVNASEWL